MILYECQSCNLFFHHRGKKFPEDDYCQECEGELVRVELPTMEDLLTELLGASPNATLPPLDTREQS